MWASTSKRGLFNTPARSLVRFNSTKNGDAQGKPVPEFNLNDIFKRIDQVTTKAAELSKQRQLGKEPQGVKARSWKPPQFKSKPPRFSQQGASNQQRQQRPFRAQNQDSHSTRPFRNQGQENGTTNVLRGKSGASQGARFRKPQGEPTQQAKPQPFGQTINKETDNGFHRQNQFTTPINSNNSPFGTVSETPRSSKLFVPFGAGFQRQESRGKPWQGRGEATRNSDNKPASRPFKRRVAGQRRDGRGSAGSDKPAIAAPIQSKELIVESLKPDLKPESFFYGKVPSIVSSISSRVASVAKLSLLDSKYPFRLPKHIIESAPASSQNRFILQKNWNLEPDQKVLKGRISSVVLGRVDAIDLKGNNNAASLQVSHDLSINPSMNLDQKQQMFDTIHSLNTLKTIFKDAHWKKAKK
ncbi:hypothetical protein FOB58_002832 [Candida parapsilosis]|uniref:Uncharacterized protein n=1 Tax=Candida parapsilosis TaxID=5480 RepID=A0A8X7NQR8_CANPA|nr:hypothetical protein FOB59_003531 [Candida parapsilosis]KAF6049555.1 hypothetical protein FOB58_002832 [Candida parapsilosis]KAF6057406.1 hypothetical protein FOB60_001961 [Candida parapsilosis]KAF6065875.1 hypothetical protein FOB61_001945 [Candida parapsilosis]